jgi:Cu/Ag efflux pump CusA
MMAAVPVSLGLGAGSETRAPMATAVIGGLIVSTVLSLLVVPAFYLFADRIKTALGSRRHGAAGEEPSEVTAGG